MSVSQVLPPQAPPPPAGPPQAPKPLFDMSKARPIAAPAPAAKPLFDMSKAKPLADTTPMADPGAGKPYEEPETKGPLHQVGGFLQGAGENVAGAIKGVHDLFQEPQNDEEKAIQQKLMLGEHGELGGRLALAGHRFLNGVNDTLSQMDTAGKLGAKEQKESGSTKAGVLTDLENEPFVGKATKLAEQGEYGKSLGDLLTSIALMRGGSKAASELPAAAEGAKVAIPEAVEVAGTKLPETVGQAASRANPAGIGSDIKGVEDVARRIPGSEGLRRISTEQQAAARDVLANKAAKATGAATSKAPESIEQNAANAAEAARTQGSAKYEEIGKAASEADLAKPVEAAYSILSDSNVAKLLPKSARDALNKVASSLSEREEISHQIYGKGFNDLDKAKQGEVSKAMQSLLAAPYGPPKADFHGEVPHENLGFEPYKLEGPVQDIGQQQRGVNERRMGGPLPRGGTERRIEPNPVPPAPNPVPPTRPPATSTATGAQFDNDVLSQVKAEHPEFTVSQQLQEAAKRANTARQPAPVQPAVPPKNPSAFGNVLAARSELGAAANAARDANDARLLHAAHDALSQATNEALSAHDAAKGTSHVADLKAADTLWSQKYAWESFRDELQQIMQDKPHSGDRPLDGSDIQRVVNKLDPRGAKGTTTLQRMFPGDAQSVKDIHELADFMGRNQGGAGGMASSFAKLRILGLKESAIGLIANTAGFSYLLSRPGLARALLTALTAGKDVAKASAAVGEINHAANLAPGGEGEDQTPEVPEGRIPVQVPNGMTYHFPDQQAADRFKQAAGVQ